MSVTAEAPNGTRYYWALPPGGSAPVTYHQDFTPTDALWDAPILFSTTRLTAWKMRVTNDGQFYVAPVPIQWATLDYVEFGSRVLRVNDAGAFV